MKINQSRNCNFNGIKLSSNNYVKTKNLALKLEQYGYNCLGHRTFFCNNTIEDKSKLINQIRNKASFYENDFGAIFLPWSGEAYFMSTPINEQKLYQKVKEFDSGAVINLAM